MKKNPKNLKVTKKSSITDKNSLSVNICDILCIIYFFILSTFLNIYLFSLNFYLKNKWLN